MDLRRQRIALVIHAAAQAQRAMDYVLCQAGSLRSSRSFLSQPTLSRSPH
jgi:hypothetical protein